MYKIACNCGRENNKSKTRVQKYLKPETLTLQMEDHVYIEKRTSMWNEAKIISIDV